MIFGGFQKLTVLDFPEHVSCIVFTKGCNFRCPFCHNGTLAKGTVEESYAEEEILSYLEKRKNLLDGVVITGGEPLMHKDIKDFCVKVKKMGYDIKLDTNGAYPEKLIELVTEGLVDYVAMDVKNSFEKYELTTGAKVNLEDIKKSISFLLEGRVLYEFRTTVVSQFHTPQDIVEISKNILGAKKYFLQNFLDSGNVLVENLTPVTQEKLDEMAVLAREYLPCTLIR